MMIIIIVIHKNYINGQPSYLFRLFTLASFKMYLFEKNKFKRNKKAKTVHLIFQRNRVKKQA